MPNFIDCWDKIYGQGYKHRDGSDVLSKHDKQSLLDRIDEHRKAGVDPLEAARLATRTHLDEVNGQLDSVWEQAGLKAPSAEVQAPETPVPEEVPSSAEAEPVDTGRPVEETAPGTSATDATDARQGAEIPAVPTPKPEPLGLITGTSAEAWADRVIQESQKRLNVGLDPELFAAYTVKGAALLERGVRDFAKWSAEMLSQFGADLQPHLQRIYDEAKLGLDKVTGDEAKLKMRKFASRAAESPDVTPEQQERFRTSSSSYYEPQSDKTVRDLVSQAPAEQLAAVPVLQSDGPNNVWVAAQMELYRRLIAAGKPDAAWGVVENAMKTGTAMGQLINQFKHLAGATPEGVMIALNRRLVSQGYDPLRPSEVLRLRVLAEGSIGANARWHELERAYRGAATDANFKAVSEARLHAIQADMEMQNIIRQYNPKVFFDTLRSLLQGNLLAPISFVANFVGNTTNLLARGGMRSVAAMIDAIDSSVRGRERVATVSMFKAGGQAAKAVVGAGPDMWRILYHGASDQELAKADAHGQIKPMHALRAILLGEYSGPTKGGKMTPGMRMALLAEASPFGMTATASLRILAATDLPFREGARARIITEAMKLRDLNAAKRIKELAAKTDRTLDETGEMETLRSLRTGPAALSQAVSYPELFFGAKENARIRDETLKAVYQNQNAATRAVFGTINKQSPFVRFLFSTAAPYVTTPVNWIGEQLSWQPMVAGPLMAKALKEGNRRAAANNAGKLLLGSMVMAAGVWLYKKGVVSPSLDSPDEQQKGRLLSNDVFPPNHINLTGLALALNGEDGTWRAGDRTIDVMRGGGIAGTLLMNAANVLRRLERQPEQPSAAQLGGQLLKDDVMLTLGYAVNQTFLRGTSDFLTAIKEGTPDAYFKTWAETVLSIPLPNTLTAVSRSMRENKPELRGDSTDQMLNNIIKNHLGFTGADKDLPYRRDLWGRPLKETPEGNLPFVYQMFDISKTRTIPADPVATDLYTLWRRTSDSRVIPSPPSAALTVFNTHFDLTREQLSRLQELTGQARRNLADAIIGGNLNWRQAPDEMKLKLLEEVWSKAAQIAKIRFLVERGGELVKKGKPVGFQP